jgi:hypothetical protein
MDKEFYEKDLEIRKDLQKLIDDGKQTIANLENKIELNKSKIVDLSDPSSNYNKRLLIVRNFVIGTIIFLISSFLLLNYIKSFNIILNVFLLIFYSLLIGLIFWNIRQNYRLLYGIIELVVGITAIYIVLNSVDHSLDILNWKIEKIMSFVGGIYILVRGIDNISITNFGKKVKDFFDFTH